MSYSETRVYELGCLRTLGYNEQISGQICHFTTQINPAITIPAYNEQKIAGPEMFVKTKNLAEQQFKTSGTHTPGNNWDLLRDTQDFYKV